MSPTNLIKKALKRLLCDSGRSGLSNVSCREEWLEAALAALPDGARILDAGAGTQKYRKYCGKLNYVSQDFAGYDGKGDASGMQTGSFDYGRLDIVCDITKIPEPDGSFDAIMCIEVLEHVPEPVLAINELARLLRPGGCIILSAPFCSLTHFSPYHYQTGLTKYWYEWHLPKNGLIIESVTSNGNYFEYLSQEIRRAPKVAEQYNGIKLGILGRLCLHVCLRSLAKWSTTSRGSGELLCYGYHVIAKRK